MGRIGVNVRHILSATLVGVSERNPEQERRRRVGLALVAGVIVLFVAQMVALAFGALEVAAVIFIVFVAGWFVLRSYQRRTAGNGG